MKGKKLVCIILCMVMCFTLLSGPWRAEAEAAAIAIPATVLGIVGLFVVSAGFTFDTVGDFRSAVTDFCNKNFNMTNGSGFMNTLRLIAPNAAGLIDIGSVIQNQFFPDFWQSIMEFFGGGEVEVEHGTPAPSEGMAYFEGVELPKIPSTAPYSGVNYMIIMQHDSSVYYKDYAGAVTYVLYSFNKTTFTPSTSYAFPALSSPSSYKQKLYIYTNDNGFINYCKENNITTVGYDGKWGYKGEQSRQGTYFDLTKLVWTNTDIVESSGKFAYYSSVPVTNGDLYTESIPVSVDSTYNPDLVYNGWMSKVEAEPWMTYDATSAVFQDITTAETDKTAPMTVTQTGVLSQGGVKVEIETDVVIPEYTGEYAVNGLTSIFPFCIPFDIYDFFSVLVAEREAPHFEFNIDFGKYGAVPVNIDLSEWEPVAKVLRTLELLGFIVGLAWATSKLIKW